MNICRHAQMHPAFEGCQSEIFVSCAETARISITGVPRDDLTNETDS